MKRIGKSKFVGAFIMALAIVAAIPTMASAHCDTMDGPTVADGKKALDNNNINYALKWVTPESEKEIKQIFEQTMKVRNQNAESKELADKYFFENLVRIHRAGEGAPFTGVKPSGVPVDEKILAADKSIEIGNLSPLEEFVAKDKMPELKERFEKVMALKNFDVNNVEAGREYIEAYVSYFHFAEGEEEEAGHAAHSANAEEGKAVHAEDSHEAAEALPIIPWSLAGVFSVTTIIFGAAYFKKTTNKR